MTNVPKNDYVNVFKPERGPGRHVSAGIHNPQVPYAPSNPLAWGSKGEWGPAKTFEQIGFENQAKQTMSYCGQDGGSSVPVRLPILSSQPGPRAPHAGLIRDQFTWEARGNQADSTFRPSAKNVAPRPKEGWTPAAPKSY